MGKKSDYSKLVAEAERAVAAVTDPDLKRAAFEKVLDDLLDRSDEPPATTHRRSPSAKREPIKKKSPSARGGPQAYVEELIEDGFFKKPKTIMQVKAELGNRGHHIPRTSLSGPLQTLCTRHRLRRQKVEGPDGKGKIYNYSNW